MAQGVGCLGHAARSVVAHVARQCLTGVVDVRDIPTRDSGKIPPNSKRVVVRLIMSGGGGSLRLQSGWIVIAVRCLRLPLCRDRIVDTNRRNQTNDPAIQVSLTQIVIGVGLSKLRY